MSPSTFSRAASAVALLASTASAAWSASSTQNVAMYWGQGDNQLPLSDVCADPSIDVVNIAFVNGFPLKRGDYPKTNFGNACWGTFYEHPTDKSQDKNLLKDCPSIEPGIAICKANGKKVLLSLGGGAPTDYYIPSQDVATYFAEFLIGAFGAPKADWIAAGKPRPFGNAAVDGFDLDLEAEESQVPSGGISANYAFFVNELKRLQSSLLISSAPQCQVPDPRLADAISKANFDMIFTQFYNTNACSAKLGYQQINSANTGFTFNKWADWLKANSKNKQVKLYLGLAAGTDGLPTHKDHYLKPDEASALITKWKDYSDNFGGVMLWEATVSARNVNNCQSYAYWMKATLQGNFKNLYKACVSSSSVAPSSTKASSTKASTTSAAVTPTATVKTPDGTCGDQKNGLVYTCQGYNFGSCCSAYGFCGGDASAPGSREAYCGTGCNPLYGDCDGISSSKSSTKASATPSSTKASSASSTKASSTKASASPSSTKASSSAASTKASSSPASSKASPSPASSKASSSPASSKASSSSPATSSSASVHVSSSASVHVSSTPSAHVSSSASSSIYSASTPSASSSAASSSSAHDVSSSPVPHSSGSVSYTPYPTSAPSPSVVYPSSVPTIVYPQDTTKGVYPHSSSDLVYPSQSSSATWPSYNNASTPCSTSTKASSTPAPYYGASSTPGYPLYEASSTPGYPVYEASSTPGYPVYEASSTPGYPVYGASSSPAPYYPAYPASSSVKAYDAYPPSVTSKPGQDYPSYPASSTTKVITTTYVDSCETGVTTKTETITQTVCAKCQDSVTSVYVCGAGKCGPSVVTVTITKPYSPPTDVPAKPSNPPTYGGEKPQPPAKPSTPPTYGGDKPAPPAQPSAPAKPSSPPTYDVPKKQENPATSTTVSIVYITKTPVPVVPVVPASSVKYTPIPYPSAPAKNGTSSYPVKPTGTGAVPSKATGYSPPQFTGAATQVSVGMTGLLAVVAGLMAL